MPIDPKTELPKLRAELEAKGIQFKEKRTSKLMRVLYYVSLMFLWQKKFMTGYWTTMWGAIYVPDLHLLGQQRMVAGKPRNSYNDYATMFHEGTHVEDESNLPVPKPLRGPVWTLGYLFPQCLALGALGAFWSLWCLLCLGFLAPWPAPFRVWVEQRGYGASVEAWFRMGYTLPQVGSDHLNKLIDDKFCGMAYYRMAWNRKRVEKWFARHLEKLEAN
jgi:hypothetical protein